MQSMQDMQKCATKAQEIATDLKYQYKLLPDQFCFRIDLGLAMIDGKEQQVQVSISVPPDTQLPEVWVKIGGRAMACAALGLQDDQPERMSDTADVIKFIADVDAAMQKTYAK